MQRFDRCPAAGTFLARTVQYDVQHRLACLRVRGAGDLAGYLDQVTGKRPGIPPLKHRADFGRGHGQTVAHDAIDLGNHLHVGIFNAVVHRLHKMPGTIRPM